MGILGGRLASQAQVQVALVQGARWNTPIQNACGDIISIFVILTSVFPIEFFDCGLKCGPANIVLALSVCQRRSSKAQFSLKTLSSAHYQVSMTGTKYGCLLTALKPNPLVQKLCFYLTQNCFLHYLTGWIMFRDDAFCSCCVREVKCDILYDRSGG